MKANTPNKITVLPGYSGHVRAIKSNNLYGHSFSYLSKHVKTDPVFRNNDYSKRTLVSIQKESYVPPKTMDPYHNMIPTKKEFKRHKRWDCDSNNVLALRLKERQNKRTTNETIKENDNPSRFRITRKEPICGYTGFRKNVDSENIYGIGFRESLMLGNSAKLNLNENKSLPPVKIFKNSETRGNHYNTERFVNGIIPGYTGYRPSLDAENIYGKTFGESNRQIK